MNCSYACVSPERRVLFMCVQPSICSYPWKVAETIGWLLKRLMIAAGVQLESLADGQLQ
jgi:hypothetical protein